jgi:hypothetical protein
MDIKPGTRILLKKDNDKIVLQPLTVFTQKLAGLTGGSIGKEPKGVEQFIDKYRQEGEP